jgi:hypothetical protein
MTKGNTICPWSFHGGGIKMFGEFFDAILLGCEKMGI